MIKSILLLRLDSVFSLQALSHFDIEWWCELTKITQTLHIWSQSQTSVPELSWTLPSCMPFIREPSLPWKTADATCQHVFLFVFATLPFEVSCIWFSSLVGVCVLSECVKVSSWRWLRSSVFSQSLQTQLFNTSDRQHLCFYTSRLHSKIDRTVQI